MRLTFRSPVLLAAALLFALPAAPRAAAQQQMGNPPFTPFKDTGLLKPPAGHSVAILEFEDLECPACAHAFPIVHTAIDHYKIPLLRHDFLIPNHFWSRDAAITARYLQDKVSPDLADQYRRDVFANQMALANKDDFDGFTRKWFAGHHQNMPFALGPNSVFAAEVQSDCTLGDRVGLIHTPTIVVVTNKGWIEVTDPNQLYTALDRAIAANPAPSTVPALKGGPRKPTSGAQSRVKKEGI